MTQKGTSKDVCTFTKPHVLPKKRRHCKSEGAFCFVLVFTEPPNWETQFLANERKTKNPEVVWQKTVTLEHKELKVALVLEYTYWRSGLTHRRNTAPWKEILCLGFGQGISIILNRMSMQRQKHSTDKNADTSGFHKNPSEIIIYHLSKLCLSWKQDYNSVVTRISDDQTTICYRTALGSFIYSIINSSCQSNNHTFPYIPKEESKKKKKNESLTL